jgi:exosortase A-associated hydrolase 2
MVMHVHAFAEEMNKCRRMAALQATALAAAGYAVLQMDLYGCGDSSGDFADARWEIWMQDLGAAHAWLQQRHPGPLSLWGERLGALLALDYARSLAQSGASVLDKLLLCQPVLAGSAYLTQFLRLKLANEMLGGEQGASAGTQGLRAKLAEGSSLEIAGYELAPQLAQAIDGLDATRWACPARSLHWLETPTANGGMAPARQRIADAWTAAGLPLQLHLEPAPAYWLSQETSIAPAWLEAVERIFTPQTASAEVAYGN